jgi:hypothetical protein
MIAKLRRWVTPFFTRLNGIMDRHWKYGGYTAFPDHPFYFESFMRYPDSPRESRFDKSWEGRL